MAHTQPGTYLLYKEAGVDGALWPAMVYVDDFASNDVQRRRPPGYVTLLLLMGEPYRFQWASTSQLSPLDNVAKLASSAQTEEVRAAYETVAFMNEAGLGVDYWRDQLSQQFGTGTASNSTPEPEYLPSDDTDEDDDMKTALRMSHYEHYSSFPPSGSAASRSVSKRGKRQSSFILDDDENEDSNLGLYSFPLLRKRTTSPSRCPRPSHPVDDFESIFDDESPGNSARRKFSSTEESNEDPQSQESVGRSQFSGRTTLDQILGQSSLGQRSSAPTSDAIEGDISESRDFVQMAVGPDREIRALQKKDVWDRPYFQDSRSGRNHFHLKAENMWELHHDQLATIDLEDFRFVAEYLTDGDFGHRSPKGKDQMKESIAQCVSAWATGEKFGIDDMLEHITEKVQYLDWDNEDVLTIAIIIYRSPSPVLHAHESMRKWVSRLLARHFWTYIKDEGIGHLFRKRLRMLPELERDVFVARAEILTRGAEIDLDQESDEDEQILPNDADL